MGPTDYHGRFKKGRGYLQGNLLVAAHGDSMDKRSSIRVTFLTDCHFCSPGFNCEDFVNLIALLDASCRACYARIFPVVNRPIVQELGGVAFSAPKAQTWAPKAQIASITTGHSSLKA